jgi:hypothetical protein
MADDDACVADCRLATCGDGFVNAGSEACDGSNLQGQTCETLGAGTGTLSCFGHCQGFDTSGCCHGVGGSCLIDAQCCSDVCDMGACA